MAILGKGGSAGFLLLMLSVMNLRYVLTSPSYGYTFTMPLNTVQMYGDREKRSLATICVEIKPNGPLEEPYYMCKGTDFPQFPKTTGSSNIPSMNYGSTTGNRDISVQHGTTNFAQNNYNGAAQNNGGGVNNANIENFHGYTNKFSAASNAAQNGHSQHESQASLNQQSQQTSSTDVTNSQLQSQFNTGGTFHERVSVEAVHQKPIEQHQYHFAGHQQQFQPIPHQQQHHHYQEQTQHQQFQQNQQQYAVSQPGTNTQTFFQKTEQFFRPDQKVEYNASIGKLNGYESTYSESGKGADSNSNKVLIPNASYSAQHTASFSTSAAAPHYQSTATAAGTGGSTLATHTNQQFGSTQYSLHGAADCGEDCGKTVTQATSSSGAAQDGAAQYATKTTINSSAYDTQSTKSFVAGGVNTQHTYAHASGPTSPSNGNDQNPPPVPSTSYPSAALARTSDTSSFRYGGNGAASLPASDGTPVPNMGPNNTPSLGSAFLKPVSNTAYYSSEKLSSGAQLGDRRSQVGQVQQRNKQLHPFHHRSRLMLPQTIPSEQRYRTSIDEEVLQMPDWGFSTDELDLYRSTSSEKEDTNSELTGAAYPATTPPRLIPLEYLEDPVMRTFYSSLADVGPLPSFSPVHPAPAPVAYAKPPPPRITYQHPVQSCSYPPAPQFYNYNPCPPQREYSFQPVFIALPCYGQSMYQPLGSPPPAVLTGNPLIQSNLLTSTQTQTAIQTPQLLTQSEIRPENTNFATDKSTESPAKKVSSQNVQKSVGPKEVPSTTVSPTTTEDSNESDESLEESTPTAIKTNPPKIKSDVIASVDSKSTNSEKPTIVKFDTNLQDSTKTTTSNPLLEKVGASISSSTAPSVEVTGSPMDTEMSTTFKSLILTARKLAQMVTTSQEEDDMMYKDEVSTPKPAPKKVRHASRSSLNGGGGNKRRYIQQK